MPNKLINKEEMIFRQVGGIWRRVDSQEPMPSTLANYLEYLDIQIDEDTQFCRIKRTYERDERIIIYRAWNNAKITISIFNYIWRE